MNTIKNEKSIKARWDKFMKKYQDGPKSLMRGKYICAFLFTIVPIISFFVFYLGQTYYTFVLAFSEQIGVDEAGQEILQFTFGNFSKGFTMFVTGGSDFAIAFRNTMVLFVVNMVQSGFNFLIAYAFSKNMRGARFFRFSYFIPTIVSTLVLSVVVKNMLDPSGIIGLLYKDITGNQLEPLFYQDSTAWATLLGYCIWAGWYQNLLLYEGALRRIPQELLESARLDGANGVQEFFLIAIPLMWDTLSTLLIIRFTGLFTISAPILLFTDGAYNTQTISFWFYSEVQYNNSTHTSAAMGLIMTLVGMPIVFLVRYITTRISDGLEY